MVTTALLGTDRRPSPEGSAAGRPRETDPVDRVLGGAARHRTAVRAGRRLESCPPPDHPPGPALVPAPPSAQDQMAEFLALGDVAQVNGWLTETAEQGLGLAAEHWVAVATLAAGTSRVDRRRLATVLGPDGRWFVGRNPEWARLTAALPATLNGPTG